MPGPSDDHNLCAVCQIPANLKCARCYNIYYCTKEHQRDDWKQQHKFACRPFKIDIDHVVLGRHLVATRPIKAGALVLKERALITGPAQLTVAVCLGCGKAVNADNSRGCSKCGWPVCKNDFCEKSPSHIPECRITIQRGNKVSIKNFAINHPTYQCITVLRCLYQKQFLPKVWKKLDALESHCDKRQTTAKYDQERTTVAAFIRRFFNLQDTFTEEEIMRVCGIVAVNSHEVPLTEPSHLAIYETGSLFEHNCQANCSKSFTNAGELLITAARPIEPGEHLSICYTDPLWGTPNRRHHLFETKFFWCTCSRCSDPTEFDTYFSAICCRQRDCNNGFLLPSTFLNDQFNNTEWRCTKCTQTMSAYYVHDILERIGRDLADVDKTSVQACQQFLNEYESYLHPNHFYLTDIKLALCHHHHNNGISKHQHQLFPSTEDLMEVKLTLCRDLLKLIRVIAPAEKRVLGLLLFELHAVVTQRGRLKQAESSSSSSSINSDMFKSVLLESKKMLTASMDYLKNEPDSLPEGKVYRQAKLNLKDLNSILDNMTNVNETLFL